MKILRALIIEDEEPAREELKYLLREYGDVEVVGEADNGITGLHLIEKLKPDVIFLDINIPKIHGCELARHISSISEIGKPPFVVFVTAYDIHAIDAFEIGVVDYLLKPISHQRLYKTLEKIRSLYKEIEIPIEKLAVEKNERIKLLDLNQIVFAEAHEGNVLIKTKNETFIYRGTMKSLEEKLKDKGFFRVQKSYIVNFNKILEILPWFKGTYWLVMDDDKKTQIPVSKSQIKELKNLLGLDRET
ncbi:MAG: LytR/AlgR family response regulator transcription factor [Caldanaerobacter sp.]|uniref:LytR/AlgR family response regulator transcription factor n=1 Tax=Caldanaerobacter sp. TaxID=2930036 RepID=UPI003C70C36F